MNCTTVNKRDARDYTLVQYRMLFYIRYRHALLIYTALSSACLLGGVKNTDLFTASSQPQPPTRARQHDAWILVGALPRPTARRWLARASRPASLASSHGGGGGGGGGGEVAAARATPAAAVPAGAAAASTLSSSLRLLGHVRSAG